MTKGNDSNSKTILTGFVAHTLKNSLAEISAEAHRLHGNENLLRAVRNLSRIVSDSFYYQQLQENDLPAPPGEEIPAAEVLELLQLRLRSELEVGGISLNVSVEAETHLFTNLDFSLDALERLVLVSLNQGVLNRVLPIRASARPPCITLGPCLADPTVAFWPDPSFLKALPERERLSFLVSKELFAFLGCRLETRQTDSPTERLWLLCFPEEPATRERGTHG